MPKKKDKQEEKKEKEPDTPGMGPMRLPWEPPAMNRGTALRADAGTKRGITPPDSPDMPQKPEDKGGEK